MVTEVKPLQPEKALSPILVTLLEMLMAVRLLQPEKAPLPMHVTLSGMVDFLHPIKSVLVLVSMIALQLSRESYLGLPGITTIDSRPLHPSKAELLMLITLSGMVIDIKALQPVKAELSMLVTLSVMVIEVRLLHL